MRDKAYYAEKIVRELTGMIGENIRDRQEAVLEAYLMTIYSMGVRDGIAKALVGKEPESNG